MATTQGRTWFSLAVARFAGRRTARAVKERARHLGLPMPRRQKGAWLEEEDQILIQAAREPALPSNWVRELAETIPHRTFNSVKNRVNRLGLVQRRRSERGFVRDDLEPPSHAPVGRKWEPIEGVASFGGLAEPSQGRTVPRPHPKSREYVINPKARAERTILGELKAPVPPTPVDCDDEATVVDANVVELFSRLERNRAAVARRSRTAMRALAIEYGDSEYLDTDEEVIHGPEAQAA